MSEGVTERVRMNPSESSILAPTPNHLPDPGRGHPALASQPEPRKIRLGVLCPLTQIAVDGLHRLGPDRQESLPASLTQYPKDSAVQVHVSPILRFQPKVGNLGQP